MTAHNEVKYVSIEWAIISAPNDIIMFLLIDIEGFIVCTYMK